MPGKWQVFVNGSPGALLQNLTDLPTQRTALGQGQTQQVEPESDVQRIPEESGQKDPGPTALPQQIQNPARRTEPSGVQPLSQLHQLLTHGFESSTTDIQR